MFPYLRISILAAALALLAACSPVRTGVTGNTLTTNASPSASVTANAPFALAGHGRLWVTPASDAMGNSTSASFDYAIYTDAATPPARGFAYAAIIRLTDKENWFFEPQTWKLPGALYMRSESGPIGLAWTTQVLSVPSAYDDWISDLWRTNKQDVPETWIAKRWIASMDDGMRVLVEYREAWPQCAEEFTPGLPLTSKEDMCLRDFGKRADAVFTVAPGATDLGAAAPPAGLALPQSLPDLGRLVGKVKYNDKSSGGVDIN